MIKTGKMFALIFLPAALALVFGLALVQQKNRELSAAQFENQLKNQWLLVSIIQRAALDGEAFKNVGRTLGLRVTLVERDGRVVFDSGAGDEALEDHAQREEVRSAFLGVPAMVARRSATTGIPTIYYADRLGPDLVLRVAYPAEFYQAQSGALMTQAFSGLLALMVAVAAFALLVSRSAARTLRRLGRAVTEARNGSQSLPSFDDDSLDGALYSLSAATRELRQFGRENADLNDRLRYILDNIGEGVVLTRGDQILYSNEKAAEILNYRLPGSVSEVNQAEMVAFLEAVTGPAPPAEASVGGRTISLSSHASGQDSLAILHDISDRLRYTGYKSDLVANVSHELKTPLTLVMTASEVLTRDPGMPREKSEKFLATILSSARRLNALLDDLIALHRLESQGRPEGAECDLDDVMGDVADLVDPAGKEIVWSADGGRAGVHSSHLASVLVNLVANAVKYSSGRKVEASVRREDGDLVVRVADLGPPVPPSERGRIFERFYSLSPSRNREHSGSGLGLSIVKHIARLYGGQAFVDLNEHGGNTFTVRLTEKPGAKAAGRDGGGS
jgi:two-component system phosphate regulon sensor histidine kinase PhoR